MKRMLGAVGGALRALAPRMSADATSLRASATPRYHAAHLARVRHAMESLAPKGEALPSEGRVLASQALTRSKEDRWCKSPAETFAAANALFQVTILQCAV